MTAEGFAAFYDKGTPITTKLQEQIDSAVRTYIAVMSSKPLDTEFMPLSTISAYEFQPILFWIRNKLDGAELFEDGIYYKDIQTDEDIDNLYQTGGDLLEDLDAFKSALYEQKPLKEFQQKRIDQKVGVFL